jgi:Ulp1 family protease
VEEEIDVYRAVPAPICSPDDTHYGDSLFVNYMEPKPRPVPSILLIPVNSQRNHRCLFVIKTQEKIVEFWDSMEHDEDQHQRLKVQLRRRLGACAVWGEDFEWTFVQKANIPKQTDGFNCGVMLLLYAESIVLKTNLCDIRTTSDDLVAVRKKIWTAISGNCSSTSSINLCNTA